MDGELWTPADWFDYGYACGESGWDWLRTVRGHCLTHAERGSLAAGWRAGQDAASLRQQVDAANAEAADQRMRERAGELVAVCGDDIPF